MANGDVFSGHPDVGDERGVLHSTGGQNGYKGYFIDPVWCWTVGFGD